MSEQTARSQWSLQDAKAHFSEVVRRARDQGPQRVSVHGRDAVVVVDAAEFDRLRPATSGQTLVDVLAAAPLDDVDFDRVSIRSPVRPVDL